MNLNSVKIPGKYYNNKKFTSDRRKKLLRLRNKISSGKYRISNEALARALYLAQ